MDTITQVQPAKPFFPPLTEMVPWVVRPGMTVRQELLFTNYYKQMAEADQLKYAFCHTYSTGGVFSMSDWYNLVTDESRILIIFLTKGQSKAYGHALLTHFEGYMAQVHFNVLPEYHGKQSIPLVQTALQQIFSMKRVDDLPKPFLKTLIGMTPTWNRLACRFLKKVGFTPLATIPDSCFDLSGKPSDSVLSILTSPKVLGYGR